MFNRRRFIATSSGLGLAAALGGLARAQEMPGGGGGASDPGQVLPGPFGPLGGNPGDLPSGPDGSKEALEEGAENLQEFGDWAMTVGEGGVAIGGGIAVVTGETGIGLVVGAAVGGGGAGLFIGGAFSSGVGMAMGWMADDPPRPNYQVSPTCGMPSASAIPGASDLDPAYREMLASSLALYSSSASTLAALEFWQGAHAAGDAQWRTRHRASFVSGWNQMRQDLKDHARACHNAVDTFGAAIRQRPNGMQTLRDRVQQKLPQMQTLVQQELATLETGLSGSCPHDARLFAEAATKYSPPAQMASFSDIQAKLIRIGQVADRLPVYS